MSDNATLTPFQTLKHGEPFTYREDGREWRGIKIPEQWFTKATFSDSPLEGGRRANTLILDEKHPSRYIPDLLRWMSPEALVNSSETSTPPIPPDGSGPAGSLSAANE